MIRARAILLAGFTLFSVTVAHAQSEPGKTPSRETRASAVATIAAEIAKAIGNVEAGAIVIASPVTSDSPAPKSEELAVRIATQVAGRLGSARALPQTASLAVARGQAGRAASLLYVQLEIAKGELRATADLYTVVSNGWERLRNPAPGPRAHAFVSAPLDAEVRSFMTPILLEQASVHKAKHEEGEVLAVGCGDIDGDGGLELVLVSRARVAMGRVRGGKFVPQKTSLWTALASRVPVPLREPLASVIVSPRGRRGEIFVGTTDRGGVGIDASLVTRQKLSGLPVPGTDGDACTLPSADASAFDGQSVSCVIPTKGDPAPMFALPSSRVDAVAFADLVAKDGRVSPFIAAREPSSGKLRVRRLDDTSAKPNDVIVEGAGAQVAVGDLDLDGIPEIVTTSDTGEDVLTIASITKDKVTPRLRLPAKEGIRAIGLCPAEERGVPAVVAVVGAEVWLVR